jgi:hypothetical protein
MTEKNADELREKVYTFINTELENFNDKHN